MTKHKALKLALKITKICRNQGISCKDCAFNFNGCILSDGHGTFPLDWMINRIKIEELSNND